MSRHLRLVLHFRLQYLATKYFSTGQIPTLLSLSDAVHTTSFMDARNLVPELGEGFDEPFSDEEGEEDDEQELRPSGEHDEDDEYANQEWKEEWWKDFHDIHNGKYKWRHMGRGAVKRLCGESKNIYLNDYLDLPSAYLRRSLVASRSEDMLNTARLDGFQKGMKKVNEYYDEIAEALRFLADRNEIPATFCNIPGSTVKTTWLRLYAQFIKNKNLGGKGPLDFTGTSTSDMTWCCRKKWTPRLQTVLSSHIWRSHRL